MSGFIGRPELPYPYSYIVQKPDPAVEYYEAYKNIGRKYTRLTDYDTPVVVKQAAIDALGSSGGGVFCKRATYLNESKATIKENCELAYERGSVIDPAADVDLFEIKLNSHLRGNGVYIDTRGAFTKNIVVVDGATKLPATVVTGITLIEGIQIHGDHGTGQGTAFKYFTEADDEYICWVTTRDILIQGMTYGFLLEGDQDTGTPQTYINANLWENIRGYGTRHFIYLNNLHAAVAIQNNVFNNINYQWNPLESIDAIYVDGGQLNEFYGKIWDAAAIAAHFKKGTVLGTKYNFGRLNLRREYILDEGDRNQIQTLANLDLRPHGVNMWHSADAPVDGNTAISERFIFTMVRKTGGVRTVFDSAIRCKPKSSTESIGEYMYDNVATEESAGAIALYEVVWINSQKFLRPLYALT